MRVEWSAATEPTGLRLAEALGGVSSEYVLNWGRTASPGRCPFPRGKTINVPSAVGSASDKYRMRTHFIVSRVPSPRMYDMESAKVIVSEETPLIGRRSRHTRGQGLWIYRTPEEVMAAARSRTAGREASHYLEVIQGPNIREYRVHVVAEVIQ